MNKSNNIDLLINKYKIIIFMAIALFLISKPYGFLLMAGDFGWIYNFSEHLEKTVHVWDDKEAFGYNAARQLASMPTILMGSLLEEIGIKNWIIQRALLYITALAGMIGMFNIGKYYKFKPLQSFFSSLIYNTSGFALIYITPNYGFQFVIYFYSPMAIWMLLKYLETQKIIYLIIIALLPTHIAFGNPTFFINYYMLIFLFGPIAVLFGSTKIKIKKIELIEKTTIFILFILFVNLYWIIPFITDLNSSFGSASNEGVIQLKDNEIAKQDSLYLYHSIIGLSEGFWVATASDHDNYYYSWHSFALSNINIIFHALILIGSILYVIKLKNKTRGILFLLSLFLVFVFLVSGLKMSSPSNILHEIIFTNEYIARAYRATFMKIGILLSLSWSLFASYYVMYILNYKSYYQYKKIKLIAIIITIFIIGFPYFSGQIFKDQDNYLPAHWTSIPNDYSTLKNVSKNLDAQTPLLVLPSYESYNILTNWEGHGFIGGDFIKSFWQGPVIYGVDKSIYYSELINCINTQGLENCSNLIKKIGIEYILLRYDIDPRWNIERNIRPIYYTNQVDSQFELVLNSNNLTLLKVKDSNNINFFFDVACNKYENDYYNVINHFKSENKYDKNNVIVEKTSFQRISPGKYRISINGLNSCQEIFIKKRKLRYSKDWLLCLPNIRLNDQDQKNINSFKKITSDSLINLFYEKFTDSTCIDENDMFGWSLGYGTLSDSIINIDNKNSMDITIYFKLQVVFYFSLALSILGFFIIILANQYIKSKQS